MFRVAVFVFVFYVFVLATPNCDVTPKTAFVSCFCFRAELWTLLYYTAQYTHRIFTVQIAWVKMLMKKCAGALMEPARWSRGRVPIKSIRNFIGTGVHTAHVVTPLEKTATKPRPIPPSRSLPRHHSTGKRKIEERKKSIFSPCCNLGLLTVPGARSWSPA